MTLVEELRAVIESDSTNIGNLGTPLNSLAGLVNKGSDGYSEDYKQSLYTFISSLPNSDVKSVNDITFNTDYENKVSSIAYKIK